MTFEEILDQTIAMLQRRGRVAYSVLKRQFDLDDEHLEDLKEAILFEHPVTDEQGRGLVWSSETKMPQTGASPTAQSPQPSVDRQELFSQANRQTTELSEPHAERRQLTVMFCDLVGSTSIAAALDPEDLREVIRAYQERASEIIRQYEGHIAQYLGDGMLVYFGWPHAHEDDAHRAVHTSLSIIKAMDGFNTMLKTSYGIQLGVRLGIHTGPVVVGEMGSEDRHENLALGETPNISARLEGVAQPGTVVISDDTRRLVAGTFDYEDLGTPDLKGVSKSIQVFRVRGLSAAASRFDARTTMLTPMVGREVEEELLMRCWEQALEGEGRVVLLSGPPGIGKSRLVQALCSRLADVPHLRLRYQCSPYHTNSTLYPIATQVARAMQLPPDADSDAKLHRLEALITQMGLPQEETALVFAEMLSIPTNDRYPPLPLTPQHQKERTLELFTQGLINMSREQPVLVLFEDVHWSDPTSLEALRLVIKQVQDARILVVITYRPEFEPGWRDFGHVTAYSLNRLSRRQTVRLVEYMTGGKALPVEVIDQIIAKTDGIPLFVEELTQYILESDWLSDDGECYQLTSRLPALAIPATLQDALMARLDRLAEVKEIAQLGATIGREFSYVLLRAVSPLSDLFLQEGLQQLLEADLISQRGQVPTSTYSFKHALIQDTAYQSMLRRTRHQVHKDIAKVLVTQIRATMQTEPEVVAHHYREAGCYEEALPYWIEAARSAEAKSAYHEAVNHFGQALESLDHMPKSRTVIAQSIDLRLELRRALLPLREFDREMDILREAESLATKLDDPQRLGHVTAALSHCLWLVADLESALNTGKQALALANFIQDKDMSRLANQTLARVSFGLGQFGKAIETFRLIQDDENNRHRVPNMRWLAESYAVVGAFTQGTVIAETAIRIAEDLDRPYWLATAYNGAGYLYLSQGNLSKATSCYRRGLDVCLRSHVNQLLHGHRLGLSLSLSLSGESAEAIILVEQSMDQLGLSGLLVSRTSEVPRVGEIYLFAGRWQEAMAYTQQQLEFACSHGELGRQALSLRLLGEIVARHDPQNGELAESYYNQALTLADELDMRPLQAHCHHSLGTLYRQTSQAEQAYAELSTAIQMYRDMEMMFWLPQAEATLTEVS